MKRCSTCKKEKPLSEFNKNKRKRDGLSTVCRECNRLRSRQYYQENYEKHRRVTNERKYKIRNRNKEYVWDWLITHPCVDCGEENPVVLDFDHRRDKTYEISYAVHHADWSLERLQEEIDKCEVRCSNCHRKRTALEENWKILEYIK